MEWYGQGPDKEEHIKQHGDWDYICTGDRTVLFAKLPI